MTASSLPTLSRSLLDKLRREDEAQQGPTKIELPSTELLDAPETILQIGSGVFLRGFVEDFLQLANAAGRFAGRVVSVQRKADRRTEASSKQDGLYTLILRRVENGQSAEKKRIIASLSRSLNSDTEWDKVIAVAAQPTTRVIVTNVTESGLGFDSSDTAEGSPPSGFPGKLTQLLWKRWQAPEGKAADIAVVPCELIEDNGIMVRKLVAQQAQAWNLPNDFSAWLDRSVHFANTLVDRIVTGTPTREKLEVEWQALGYRDELLICAEPFALFALQADDFVRQHFPVDQGSAAAFFVDDLTPYRVRKVRILNGSHTILAALGKLLGFKTVREAIEDPQLGSFVENVISREIIPSLMLNEAEDALYAQEILARFRNPSVEHELIVICTNCSTKASLRLFPSIRNYMRQSGTGPQKLPFSLAAVMLALRDLDVDDTHAPEVRDAWTRVDYRDLASVLAFARAVLTKQMEWGREEIDLDAVAPQVATFLMQIHERGLRPVLESFS